MILQIQLRSQSGTFNLSEESAHCDGMMMGVMVWASFSCLFSVVGCPACVAVLWTLWQRHRAGTSFTPNGVFMLNLTIMDLVFLFFVPFGMSNLFLWHFSSLQRIFNFLFALNLAGRPLLTACICLDCYLAVVHPVFYRTNKSLGPRMAMAAGVWTATLVQGSLSIVFEELTHSARAMSVYVIALPVILICDISILRALKCSQREGGSLHPMKKKALQIITNSMVMTVISYVPPVLAYVIGDVTIENVDEYECFVALPVLTLPTAGSAIMPLLYLRDLGCMKRCCGSEQVSRDDVR